ncbi:MAG TPA: type II toxin-antitoxin system VapC family toxin [Candidatus Udaeobacter sp.]|jgi:predicted nucleic acid-binding protein
MIYFDASYLVRLYYEDFGFQAVRQLAATDTIACAQHGQAEVIAAFHRKYREGGLTFTAYQLVLQQFADETRADAFRWLPLSPAILNRIRGDFETVPTSNFLRASDALHLAIASDNGFREVYSNDKNLLAAAPHFGVRGVNLLD